MKTIPLTQGKVAIVDDADYEDLARFKWYTYHDRSRRIFYGCRQVTIGIKKQTREAMSRRIMGAGKGEYVDHINGNGLDNRRMNLRLCSNAENCRNRHHNRNRTGYKGVSRVTGVRKKLWQAHIYLNGHGKYLGTFGSPEEAARAYDRAAQEHYQEYARPNFPQEVAA